MSKKSEAKGRKQPATFRTPIPAWIAAGIVLVLIVAGAYVLTRGGSTSNQGATLPTEISVTEAAARRDAGAFVLDVREPSEWVDAHVAGATLIPLGQLPNRLNEVPRDKDVVVICRTGHRSAQGRDILLRAGFTRVTSVAGGLTAWSAQGLQTASGQ